MVRKSSKPDEPGHKVSETAMSKFGLGAREFDRMLNVARTPADPRRLRAAGPGTSYL